MGWEYFYSWGVCGILACAMHNVWASNSIDDSSYWQAGLPIQQARNNIYKLQPEIFEQYYRQGELHAQLYPVSVTGLLLPFEALNEVLEAPSDNPLRALALEIGGKLFAFKNFRELYDWLGLAPYSASEHSSPYALYRPAEIKAPHQVGAGILHTSTSHGLTFSCLSCHASEFFGETIVGLPNKRSRSNELFTIAKKMIPLIPSTLFRASTHADNMEVEIFKMTKKNLGSVRPRKPVSLGVDTSLSHVALSLSTRRPDAWATKDLSYRTFPTSHELDHARADSKPLPWWNVKYKNRWLSDGSVISGNPVLTNILWNEIGRGTDLHELAAWMHENRKSVEELTVRIFATKPPMFLDFFPASKLDINRAKRGEVLFVQNCAKCHGTYEKGWSKSEELSLRDSVSTLRVRYHEQTPVIDVGTEANRYKGMQQLSQQLNSLEISRQIGTQVVPQTGYVPPPLDGIFSRYPYLHNASVPNLCALLEAASQRPRRFVEGPSKNKESDFDVDCVGYPVGNKIPAEWLKDKRARVDTAVQGRRAIGHDRMLFNADGSAKFNADDKKNLIEFLKTL